MNCRDCDISVCNNQRENCPFCSKCGLRFYPPLRNNLCGLCEKVESSKQGGIEQWLK